MIHCVWIHYGMLELLCWCAFWIFAYKIAHLTLKTSWLSVIFFPLMGSFVLFAKQSPTCMHVNRWFCPHSPYYNVLLLNCGRGLFTAQWNNFFWETWPYLDHGRCNLIYRDLHDLTSDLNYTQTRTIFFLFMVFLGG